MVAVIPDLSTASRRCPPICRQDLGDVAAPFRVNTLGFRSPYVHLHAAVLQHHMLQVLVCRIAENRLKCMEHQGAIGAVGP